MKTDMNLRVHFKEVSIYYLVQYRKSFKLSQRKYVRLPGMGISVIYLINLYHVFERKIIYDYEIIKSRYCLARGSGVKE